MKDLFRRLLLLIPVIFISFFLIIPLGFTFVISFWKRAGFKILPAFTLNSYAEFFSGVRLLVLERSLLVSIEATALSLLIAYPIAYFIAKHIKPELTRSILMLFTIPFLVNYIIRTFAWTFMLGRTGPINSILMCLELVEQPIDWLLYSDFAIFLGLITSYMPFMIFPLWLSLSRIEPQLVEASWLLGANPARSFFRITLPLSMPGIFAAVIFGFVGCFGESAVPIILGGVGYQLMGNTITSTMDVLNYPLAAAMSSVIVGTMLFLLMLWYFVFDMRSFLGKVMSWKV